jgi:hypothetical protein
MYISINIDTDNVNAEDAKVLRAISDAFSDDATVTALDVVKEDRKAEQAKAATTKKAAPAAKKAAPAEPAPEPEEDASEDGEDDLDAAVSRATMLVQAGKTPVVKKALAAVGVKRVSELSADHVEDFLSALDEAEVV